MGLRFLPKLMQAKQKGARGQQQQGGKGSQREQRRGGEQGSDEKRHRYSQYYQKVSAL